MNEEIGDSFFHCQVTESATKEKDTVNMMKVRSCWESVMINKTKEMP